VFLLIVTPLITHFFEGVNFIVTIDLLLSPAFNVVQAVRLAVTCHAS
jgi:hypothetical protein